MGGGLVAGLRKLSFVEYEIDYPEGPNDLMTTVSSVNITTGAVHPIVEVPTDDDGALIEWEGIATDPTTGFTHVFASSLNAPLFAFVDLAAGEISELEG